MRALALVVAGCCSWRPTWRDAALAYDAAAISCDTSQTMKFSDYGRWDLGEHGVAIQEANPYLGLHPDLVTLSLVLVANLGIVTGLRFVERAPSDVALVAIGVVETVVVASNYRYGGACGVGSTSLVRVR